MKRRTAAAFGWAACAVFLILAPAVADIEVRRLMRQPGEIEVVLPPDRSLRRLKVEFPPPAAARVSAQVFWTPADRELAVRLVAESGDDRGSARMSGGSPVALGTVADSSGRAWLVVEDPRPGSDTLLLSVILDWRAPSVTPSAPRAEVSSSPAARPAPAPSASAPPRPVETRREEAAPPSVDPSRSGAIDRITEISWTPGGTISRRRIVEEGLRIRFSEPIDEKRLEAAVRVEIGLPGSQPGLLRYEEVEITITRAGEWTVLRFPGGLVLPRTTPIRVSILGDGILTSSGLPLDADGSGRELPSGDGRPGGLFLSAFRIKD